MSTPPSPDSTGAAPGAVDSEVGAPAWSAPGRASSVGPRLLPQRSQVGPVPLRRGGWVLAQVLVLAGLAWVVTDHELTYRYPMTWGGPNIGGGLLLLVAYAATAAGTALAITQGVRMRAGAIRVGAVVVGTALVLDVAAVTAVAVVHVAEPAAAAPSGINGYAGLSVDTAGDPVLVVQVCRGSITRIDVVGPNRGSRPNRQLAALRPAASLTTATTVDLTHPGTGWSGHALDLASAPDLLIAGGEGPQGMINQVDFSPQDVRTLRPGTVQYSVYSDTQQDLVDERTTTADFPDLVCHLIPAH